MNSAFLRVNIVKDFAKAICKKQYFVNEDACNDHIKKYNFTKSGKNTFSLQGYLCPKCNHWHITKQKPSQKKIDTAIEKLKAIYGNEIKKKDAQILELKNRITKLEKSRPAKPTFDRESANKRGLTPADIFQIYGVRPQE